MRYGLYGKLPAKRDFIAEGLPPGFLALWEPWIAGGIAASRIELGAQWQPIYLGAPIWRFWIGPKHLGRTVAGVFMPSVDGIGRYFPLTAVAWMESDETAAETIVSPEEDPDGAWYLAAEDLLLSALGDDRVYDELLRDLGELPPPRLAARPQLPQGAALGADGQLAMCGTDASTASVFEGLRTARTAADYAGGIFWWTIGGGDVPAIVAAGPRMPDPHRFSSFLTGRFQA